MTLLRRFLKHICMAALCLMAAAALCPAPAQAADDETGTAPPWTYSSTAQELTCTVDGAPITLENVTAEVTNLTIGDNKEYSSGALDLSGTITGGYTITSIGKEAFYNCASLTSVTLPEGLESIGEYAFRYCTDLTSADLSAAVKLTSIVASIFSNCTGLTDITLPEGLTTIENRTFYQCSSLKSITLPDSVTEIGDYAFDGCEGLTSADLSAASGILTGGDQGLDPQGQASRAELAAMLARFCENLEK